MSLTSRRSAEPSAVPADPWSRLTAEERDAIVLASATGTTYCDVAVRLGISEAVAKQRIRSGLQRLRAEVLPAEAVAS